MRRNYSVLMSVFKNEEVKNLSIAIESILNQTRKSNDIVIVKDGPLTTELNVCLDNYKLENNNITILTLDKNVGLGNALNEGLKVIKNELVMRMDTDDYSESNRACMQIKKFEENVSLDVLGTSVIEFIDNQDLVHTLKSVPRKDNEIKHMFKYKNAINHPSVMYKKSSVDSVSGYVEIQYNEDYYLWLRMAVAGMRFENLSEPLVKMRVTKDSYERRRGKAYFESQKKIFKFLYEQRYISVFTYYFNIFNRFVTKVILPGWIVRLIYKYFLRRRIKENTH